jgi:hypothetical protein
MLTNFLPHKRERFQKVWKKAISEPYGSTSYPTQQEVKDLMTVLQDYDELLAQVEALSPGVIHIANERIRQIEKEGWDDRHDDEHTRGEMALAAACYALSSLVYGKMMAKLYPIIRDLWPWNWDQWWKPRSSFRDVERAGALCAAELDRILRKVAREEHKESTELLERITHSGPRNNRIG